MSDTGSRLLADIVDATVEVDAATVRLKRTLAGRDALIRLSLEGGGAVRDVMGAAGLSRAQVYNISRGVRA